MVENIVLHEISKFSMIRLRVMLYLAMEWILFSDRWWDIKKLDVLVRL